ncbi:MAG: type IV toxin-antitoxin system AbiEi family antitoxin domain-containing protein [Acidimicrobiia bacterium]|nr:type IV toxin-antitoxin system AbiEi family antitoxin domain-containing protein [Acidimicrobiia bacterium]
MALIDLLLEVAGEQRGFVTPADAEAVGVNPVELRKMAARGRLEHIAHGVYRFPTFPRRPNDELMAAVAWTGKRGVVAGRSALALHELCDVNPRRVELAVPPGYRPRKAGGERYRVRHARLRPRDVEVVDDVPVVVPAVAIAQAIADHIDPRLIEQAITTGRRRGDIDARDEERLRDCLAAERLHPTRRVRHVV